ncbi:MAG: DUF2818 family protein [Burkholderiaceae bacterium]|nr:DUF2818 family protein [Burkholderiaceae bacterium]MDO9089428.1 DUF2818 family protein [Burkholderiaceae bacterium]
MSQTASIWFVILAALVAANLPFLTRRLLVFIPLSSPKSLPLRLLELLVFYFLVGALGLALENHGGQIAPQTWEFYAITGALFVTLAFPGFVYRYLLKHRS